MRTKESVESQSDGVMSEALAPGFRSSVSALRVAISLARVALALVLIGNLADWSQLKLAVVQLGGQPWLLAVLVLAYSVIGSPSVMARMNLKMPMSGRPAGP